MNYLKVQYQMLAFELNLIYSNRTKTLSTYCIKFKFAIKLLRGVDTNVCNNESSSSHHTRRLTRNMIRDYPGNYGLLVGRQGAAWQCCIKISDH